ncbi:unnamed protein product, partial [Vitis vinifera]
MAKSSSNFKLEHPLEKSRQKLLASEKSIRIEYQ